MNKETKQVMDNSYDMIVELMEFIREQRNYISGISNHQRFVGMNEILSKAYEMDNKAQGVLDEINDELYKTL